MKKNKFAKITVSAAMVASSIIAVAPIVTEATEKFSDVKPTNYFYQDVLDLQQRGVISGYADGTFKPNAAVTRGQLAKILAGVLNLDVANVSNPNFSDVPSTHQYYGAIAALVKAGIISGYEDQTFRPNEKLQRHHMASILTKAFSLKANNVAALPLKDVPKNYEAAVAALYEHKITTGKTATTFDGTAHVTRGQLAAFIGRAERTNNIAPDEEQAIEKQQTFTVTNYSASSITTEAGALQLSNAVRTIFSASNEAALKNATVTAKVKNGVVTEVVAITLQAAGSETKPLILDLGGTTLQDVTINGDYTEIRNATITGKATVSGSVQQAVTFNKVNITGEFIAQQANAATASLTPMAPVVANEDEPLIVSFIDSDVYVGRIDRESISTDFDPNSSASTLILSASVSYIDVNGEIGTLDLTFATDVTLTGNANIEEVLAGAAVDLLIELLGTIELLKVLAPEAQIQLNPEVVIGLLNVPVNAEINEIITNYVLVSQVVREIVRDAATPSPTDGGGSTSGGGGGGSSSDSDDDDDDEVVAPQAVTATTITQNQIMVTFSQPLTDAQVRQLNIVTTVSDYETRTSTLQFTGLADSNFTVSADKKTLTIPLTVYKPLAVQRTITQDVQYAGASMKKETFTLEASSQFVVKATPAQGLTFDGEGKAVFLDGNGQSDNVLINTDEDGQVNILFETIAELVDIYQFVVFYEEAAYVVEIDGTTYSIRAATADDTSIGKQGIERVLNLLMVHEGSADYRPDGDTSISYVASETGDDVLAAQYWVTPATLEEMNNQWQLAHAAMTAEETDLFTLYEAQQAFLQAVKTFVDSAQPGTKIQQGLADMVAENGNVTITFNAPITAEEYGQISITRTLVEDGPEQTLTYNLMVDGSVAIEGNTITITETALAQMPFEREITYNVTFEGADGTESKEQKIILDALSGEYLTVTSSENLVLEGIGQAVIIDGSTSADTVTVGTTSDNRLIITFDELTNVSVFWKFALLLNDKEYYVEFNEDNEFVMEEVPVLEGSPAATLASEGIEKLYNVMRIDEGNVTYMDLVNDKSVTYYISNDGAEVGLNELWVTQEAVDTLADAQAAAIQVMQDGETIAEKYEAQQTLYEAIKHFLDNAQSGSKSL